MMKSSFLFLNLLTVLLLVSCAGFDLAPSEPQPAASIDEAAQRASAVPTTADTTPTESPWITGTPAPLVAPRSSECPGAGAFPPRLSGLRYGINVFLFGTDMQRALSLTDIGGFKWVRQQIHWRDLEGEQGQFVWKPLDQIISAARARDMHIMLSVVRSPEWATAEGDGGLPDDPADLAIFLQAVATRYRERVAAYQVWNEPNLAHENGGTPADPAEYLALLEAAYPAIKQADPCALVVSAALAATQNPDPALAAEDLPFFEQLYRLNDGAFRQSADIVGLHTGAGPNPPDAYWLPDTPEQSHFYFRHIERTRDLMQQYNDPRQVWITEYGWTVAAAEGAPQPVTEAQQATYLLDALWFVRHRYPWVSGIFVWNLNFSVIAPPDDEKTTFSIITPDWAVRPAFLLLQNNVHALRDVERPPFVPEIATHTYTWTFPGRGEMEHMPVLAPDGMVYVVSNPGTLYAVNPDGFLRWQFNASGAISAPPARAPDGTLSVGDSGSLLHALHPDGSARWTVRLNSPARGSPVYLADTGIVAVVSTTGQVYAFDANGHELWTYDQGVESTPLALTADGALLLVDAAGTATKLSPDGQERWRTHLGGEFWAAPVPDATGGAYVVTVGGRVLALDSAGALRWSVDLRAPVETAPLVGSGGRLYVASRSGTLYALAETDGALLWQYTADSPLHAPPAQGADGTLYQGTDGEMLLAIDRDGNIRWRMQVQGMVRAQPAVSGSNMLYVPTTGGRLYVFEQK